MSRLPHKKTSVNDTEMDGHPEVTRNTSAGIQSAWMLSKLHSSNRAVHAEAAAPPVLHRIDLLFALKSNAELGWFIDRACRT